MFIHRLLGSSTFSKEICTWWMMKIRLWVHTNSTDADCFLQCLSSVSLMHLHLMFWSINHTLWITRQKKSMSIPYIAHAQCGTTTSLYIFMTFYNHCLAYIAKCISYLRSCCIARSANLHTIWIPSDIKSLLWVYRWPSYHLECSVVFSADETSGL